MILDGRLLSPPRLSFDAALPSRAHEQAFRGMAMHGPYDASRVELEPDALLFVFPEHLRPVARQLALALRDGYKGFSGFERMFRLPVKNEHIANLSLDTKVETAWGGGETYRDQIRAWNARPRERDPQLAFVVVPHSEPWETNRPYYEAKAMFAKLGIPTQMVTAELLQHEREFSWSVANIALAAFAKLGGIPWVIEAPPEDNDLIIGVGRADIRHEDGVRRIFGYAMSFVSNGIYSHTWSFTPAADEDHYVQRLEEQLVAALQAERGEDQPYRRLVIHLGRKTGRREIDAVEAALRQVKLELPVAYLRLDDTTLFDIVAAREDTMAPPKGLAVRLSSHRMLLQAEGASNVGVPDGPLLIELDQRSQVEPEALEDLAAQAFRLAHANWRGFNARSHPVTLAYGEQLAKLVGYLEDVDTWDFSTLSGKLRDRPWFL